MIRLKKIKLCTVCEEKEAFLLTKSLISGWKSYLCMDCFIRQGELQKEAKEFRQKKEPWKMK